MRVISWNVNGWQPTLERIRDRYGGLASFMRAVCDHYGQEGVSPATDDVENVPAGVTAGQQTHGQSQDQSGDCILCLQEVKITQKKLTKENCCMSEECLESFHSTSDVRLGYSGTSVYARTPTWRPTKVRYDLFGGSEELDNEGRFCAVDLHPNIVLVNVYVPNAGLGKGKGSNVGNGEDKSGHGSDRIAYKLKFYERLLAFCEQVVNVEKREVVLVGDFNACFDARDVHPLIGIDNAFLKCELDALRAFTSRGFVDAYRVLHPDEIEYTCFDQKTNARQYNRGVRIDFCLVSAGLVGKLRRCEVVGEDVVPARWSDHCALFVEIDVEGATGGEVGTSLPAWVQLKKKLTNSSQRTLKDMFGMVRKKTMTERGEDGGETETREKKTKVR